MKRAQSCSLLPVAEKLSPPMDESCFSRWSIPLASEPAQSHPLPKKTKKKKKKKRTLKAESAPEPRKRQRIISEDDEDEFEEELKIPIRLESYCEDELDAEFVADDEETILNDDADSGAVCDSNTLPVTSKRVRRSPVLFGEMVSTPSDDDLLEDSEEGSVDENDSDAFSDVDIAQQDEIVRKNENLLDDQDGEYEDVSDSEDSDYEDESEEEEEDEEESESD